MPKPLNPMCQIPEDHPVRVLDPCSGGRMMWFDRQNKDVVFGDKFMSLTKIFDEAKASRPSRARGLKLPKPSTLITTEDVGHRSYTTAYMADAYRMGLAATYTTSEGDGS